MDVVSVAQLGRQGTDDAILLDQALTEGRVLLTRDTDFLRIANERWGSGITFAPNRFLATATLGHFARRRQGHDTYAKLAAYFKRESGKDPRKETASRVTCGVCPAKRRRSAPQRGRRGL
jgi:hypothetical protein